ncbi:MAG: sulfotransferase [Pseudomonadota bacterium]
MTSGSLDDYSYVFVLTYGRSGSTILMRLLNTIDGADIRGENSNALFHLHKAIAAVRRSSTRFGTTKRATSDPWYGADLMAAKSFETHCLNSFLQDVLAPAPTTRIIGFKEINHLPNRMDDKDFFGFVDFILKSFPKARIVFNTRNAEQVSRSGWFADMDPTFVKEQIAGADARFVQATKQHSRCYLIDYSDVVANNDALMALFDWLDMPLDPETVANCLDQKLSHMSKKEIGLSGSLRETMRRARSRLKKLR